MTGNTMSLYGEYLDAKSELISKNLKFKRAVEKWFSENPKIILIHHWPCQQHNNGSLHNCRNIRISNIPSRF